MTDAIRLPIPAAGEDLCRYFREQFEDARVLAALDLGVVEFDELAQLQAVTVTAVETAAAGVAVHYTVRWTAFHACDDRRFGGEHARLLRGRVEGDEWVFDRFQSWPAQRDTADEF